LVAVAKRTHLASKLTVEFDHRLNGTVIR